jgi:hypothetical protein
MHCCYFLMTYLRYELFAPAGSSVDGSTTTTAAAPVEQGIHNRSPKELSLMLPLRDVVDDDEVVASTGDANSDGRRSKGLGGSQQ